MGNQALEIDGQLVDPITGEVLEYDPNKIDTQDLANLGRWIDRAKQEIDHRQHWVSGCVCDGCNLAREIEKLIAIRSNHIDRLNERVRSLETSAEELMKAGGHQRLAFPGLGKFAFRASERVNTNKFEELDMAEKMRLYETLESAFKSPKEFIPEASKKAIKGYLRDGTFDKMAPEWGELFSISSFEHFGFTPEK